YVIGQENVGESVEKAAAQRLGETGVRQLQSEDENDVAGDELVGKRSAEALGVGLPAQKQERRQQHGKGEQAQVIDDEEILDQAQAGDFGGNRRHGEQNKKVHRQRVELPAYREKQQHRRDDDEDP